MRFNTVVVKNKRTKNIMSATELCTAFASILDELQDRLPKEHESNVIITKETLLTLEEKDPVTVEEMMIDCLSCHNLDGLETENTLLSQLVEKARKRDVGDIFLYPNSASLSYYGTDRDDRYNIDHVYSINGESFKGYHISVPCWITSCKNDNWPRHPWEDTVHKSEHCYFIGEYLPLLMFKGKKEGDTIAFEHQGRDLKLRLCQRKYRYKNRNFEDLTSYLTKLLVSISKEEDGDKFYIENAKLIEKEYNEYKSSVQ